MFPFAPMRFSITTGPQDSLIFCAIRRANTSGEPPGEVPTTILTVFGDRVELRRPRMPVADPHQRRKKSEALVPALVGAARDGARIGRVPSHDDEPSEPYPGQRGIAPRLFPDRAKPLEAGLELG